MVPAMMVSRRAALVLVVAASSLAAALSHDEEAAGPEYSYAAGSKLGPENWAKLSPKYAACNGGAPARKQSPIDTVTKQAVPKPDLDSLNSSYAAANATLVNNGKDISMTFAGKVKTVTIGGKGFSLKKAQWRSPSEHTINGQRHPLELHLVHESDAGTGELAVITILYIEHEGDSSQHYKLDAPDFLYFQLKRKLAELASDRYSYGEEDARAAVGLVHLRSLQKRRGSYFQYMGSPTAPPCTENVYWNVLSKVRQMSKDQLDLLTAPLPAVAKQNARLVQPLNGRVVTFYSPHNSTVSFQI